MANQGLQALNHQKKEEVWAKRIRQCRDSGLGVQAWCAEQGLSYHTYYKWQQKLYHKYSSDTETGFYELKVSSGSNLAAVTVHLGANSADIYNGADEQTIQFVLRALKTC